MLYHCHLAGKKETYLAKSLPSGGETICIYLAKCHVTAIWRGKKKLTWQSVTSLPSSRRKSTVTVCIMSLPSGGEKETYLAKCLTGQRIFRLVPLQPGGVTTHNHSDIIIYTLYTTYLLRLINPDPENLINR